MRVLCRVTAADAGRDARKKRDSPAWQVRKYPAWHQIDTVAAPGLAGRRLFVAGGPASTAHARTPQINVGVLFDYLPPPHSNLLKRIRNTGDATAYVRVEVTQMHFDAEGKASETPVDGAALVRNDPATHGVIASRPRAWCIAVHATRIAPNLYRNGTTADGVVFAL